MSEIIEAIALYKKILDILAGKFVCYSFPIRLHANIF